MDVEIRLYSGLKDYAPGESTVFSLSLPPGARVADAMARLAMPPALDCVMILDGRRATRDTPLSDGAVLVLFSVISGG